MKTKLGAAIVSFFFIIHIGCSRAQERPQQSPELPSSTEKTTPPAALPPADWSQAILYFVIVDRFADGDKSNNADVDVNAKGTFHGGDLKGLIQQIDQIAELGVNALWITPVVKNIDGFVTGAGFPDWGYHGYWADDFTRMDPRFGTEDDLRNLVSESHRRGIRVLLDVVYNHAGYNSNYLKNPQTRTWFRSEDLGTCGTDDLTSCLSGLPDFKTEQPEVADYLMDAQLERAERAGLDGFRLDTVKHVDHPFWKEHRARAQQMLGKDFFLLGEVWGGDPEVLDPWFSGDEMDAGFDFSFQGNVLSFVQGRGRTVAFDRYLKSREKIRTGYLVSHFLSSHDVPGGLYQLKGDVRLFRLAALLQFTSIGIPMIYYGEEVARPGGDWPENRSDMPWGDRKIMPGAGKPRDEQLRADYKKLISIRRDHPALSRGIHTALSTEGDLLVFQQEDSTSGDVVIVAINRGEAARSAKIQIPQTWQGKTARDVWNATDITLSDGMISVDPKSARILTTGSAGANPQE